MFWSPQLFSRQQSVSGAEIMERRQKPFLLRHWKISQKKGGDHFWRRTKPGLYGRTAWGLKGAERDGIFFPVGKEAEKFPDIVKKIHEGGHLIGTHSYEHVNLCNLTDEAAVEQVDKTNQVILELTGSIHSISDRRLAAGRKILTTRQRWWRCSGM